MKVLIDPIYSAKPSHCSSALKAKRIIEHTLDTMGRTDIFFRLLIPNSLMDTDTPEAQEELAWFPKHPQVQLIGYPFSKDRMREYQKFGPELDSLVAFNGACWDNDVVVTMRTQQVPNMKIVMTSPRHRTLSWLKKVLVYEEMPVMSFKPTVGVSNAEVQDMATVFGYLAADKVFITIQHEKQGILETAFSFLAPRKTEELRRKIKVASPVRFDSFEEKAPQHRFRRGKRPFCLGFTGRMTPAMSRLETVYEVAEMNWILKGDQGFRMVFSTVTTGIKKPPPPFAEVMHLPREQFWALIRSELDLVICMDIDAGFGMSFFEPILFGTPMVVGDKPWSRALLGDKYPYFVRNMNEAYAVVGAFHDQYEKEYARFHHWQQTEMKSIFSAGGLYETNLYEGMYAEWKDFESESLVRYRQEFPRKEQNDIVGQIVKKVGDRQEIVLHDVLRELASDGVLQGLGRKLDWGREDSGIIWATPWNDFRVNLKAFYGWVDASPRVGHLRRV